MIDLDPATGQGSTDTHSSAKRTDRSSRRSFIVVISIGDGAHPGRRGPAAQDARAGPGARPDRAAPVGVARLHRRARRHRRRQAPRPRHRPPSCASITRCAATPRFLGGAVSAVTAMMLAYASYIARQGQRRLDRQAARRHPRVVGRRHRARRLRAHLRCASSGSRRLDASWRERAVSLGAVHRCARSPSSSASTTRTLFLWPGVILILVAFALGAPVFVAMSGAGHAALLHRRVDRRRSRRCRRRRCSWCRTRRCRRFRCSRSPATCMAAGGASQRLVRAYKCSSAGCPAASRSWPSACGALHHLHRRLGRHHPGARRARLPGAHQGQVPRGLLARPRHRVGLARPAVSRRRCR